MASISLSDCELKMLCLCCIAKIGKIHFGSVLLNKFQKLNLVFLGCEKIEGNFEKICVFGLSFVYLFIRFNFQNILFLFNAPNFFHFFFDLV